MRNTGKRNDPTFKLQTRSPAQKNKVQEKCNDFNF
jgi:hypothetical protein